MSRDLSHARLYAILDLGYADPADLEGVADQLIAGGADVLQLRAKGRSADEIESYARRVQPICRAAGIPFIINDFPEIAARVDADGVHVGQDDGSLFEARTRFQSVTGESSSSILFGRSTHSPEQARAALTEGFDYIGFGPLFPTPTKLGRPGIGLAEVRATQNEVGSRIPMFCIGGIRRENLSEVVAAGARRVVIVSDLLSAPDISAATASARNALTAG